MSDTELSAFSVRAQQLLHALVKSYERCEEMCLAQQGVTVAQGYAMLALPPDGRVTMNDLSEKMELANSTMTRMVDQLVDKGLVRRDHDEEDRRVVWVELTPHGQKVRGHLDKAQRELLQGSLREIQADDRATLLLGLEKLMNLLSRAAKSCR